MQQCLFMIEMREVTADRSGSFQAQASFICAAIKICVITGVYVIGQGQESRPNRASCGVNSRGMLVVPVIKAETFFQKGTMIGQSHQI